MRCSINSERGELWSLLVPHMLKNFNICVVKIISSNIYVCFSFSCAYRPEGGVWMYKLLSDAKRLLNT